MSTPNSPAFVCLESTLITILEASTVSTTPSWSATTHTLESVATTLSIPVPTSGFSARNTGTACRCIFEPISARLASSCSRNGIKEAATEDICLESISIKVTSDLSTNTNSFLCLPETRSSCKKPLESTLELA